MLSLSILVAIAAATGCHAQQVIFEWKYLNFSWPSARAYENAVETGAYIPDNTVITGIKVYKDNVYLTLPRWRNGIPVTLAVLRKNESKTSPLLRPYPNWQMQTLDDCSAFQYVQSMEIDPRGRMWILDNGRTEFRTERPRTKCPPRLVILDLEDDGRILLDYEFPEGVASKKSVFLNDLALDHEDGGYAYITDHDSEKPGIVVFSLRDKAAWKVSNERSMTPAAEAVEYEFEDGNVMVIEGPIDGIALSGASTEGDRTLYYTPLSSYEMFSVPVAVLKDRKLSADVDKYVKILGRKTSQTDGMVVDAKGLMYFGLLTESAVNYYDTTSYENFTESQRVLYRNEETNRWPDTFAMDEGGWLWWTPNSLQNYFTNRQGDVNYRVVATRTSSKSYQYYPDGSCPELPRIN